MRRVPSLRSFVRERARLLALVFLVLACLAACNGILGLDPLTVYDGSVEPDAQTEDAPSQVDGSGVDAGPNSGGEAGSIGEAGRAPCDPDASPPATATYVSNTDDGGSGTGTAAEPSTTIADGISLARLRDSTTVVVEEGTYAERVELQNLPLGITIDGAWKRAGGVWTRDCSEDRVTKTVIASPADVGVVFRNIPVKSVLSNLSVRTADAPAASGGAAGSSRYGVLVDNSAVALENVSVTAGSGGGGGGASNGAVGTPLCNGLAPSCVAAPVNGGDAPAAQPAKVPGAFGAAGFTPANGAPGVAAGGAGTHGANPPAVAPFGPCELGCVTANGCGSVSGDVTPGLGRCGCGGGGGGPGGAGFGGGASVALLAVGASASVLVTNSELVARNGGDGSAGGEGGAGAAGTAGAAGASVACSTVGCCTSGTCPGEDCVCFHPADPAWNAAACGGNAAPPTQTVPGGGAGGNGRPGGLGAHGGAGAGGPAYAFVPVNALVVLTDSRRAYGKGGIGPGGAVGGPTGEKP